MAPCDLCRDRRGAGIDPRDSSAWRKRLATPPPRHLDRRKTPAGAAPDGLEAVSLADRELRYGLLRVHDAEPRSRLVGLGRERDDQVRARLKAPRGRPSRLTSGCWIRESTPARIRWATPAGGLLSISGRLRARDQGLPLPVATMLLSPWGRPRGDRRVDAVKQGHGRAVQSRLPRSRKERECARSSNPHCCPSTA
jgi:hypothetical protein